MSDLLEQTKPKEAVNPLEDMGPPPAPTRVETTQGRWRRTKQVGLTGKLPKELVKRIEYRLQLPGGSTLVEIAADLQNRFGSDQSPDEADSPAMKIARREQRKKEQGAYLVQVRKYILATYGEEIKDDHGRLVGVGDQIVVERGHWRRVY